MEVTKGILAILAASLLYGVMPVIVKELLNEGMTGECIVAWRFGTAFVICAAVAWRKKNFIRISFRQTAAAAMAGIVGFGMTASLLTVSYSYISVGLATMLHFSYPLFVLLYEFFVDRKKIGGLRISAVIFMVLGLAFMIGPDSSNENIWKGTACALLSGVSYAYYVLANKRPALAQMNSLSSMFYILLFGSVFFIGKTVFRRTFTLPLSFRGWGLAVSLGFFCTVLALYFLIYGIRVLGAANAALLNIAEPLTSVAAGAVIYQDMFDEKTVVGFILIIAAIALISLSGVANGKSRTRGNRRPDDGRDPPED